jgi:hypothetical protein
MPPAAGQSTLVGSNSTQNHDQADDHQRRHGQGAGNPGTGDMLRGKQLERSEQQRHRAGQQLQRRPPCSPKVRALKPTKRTTAIHARLPPIPKSEPAQRPPQC